MCNVYCNIYIRCQYLMSHNFSPGNNFKHIDKIDFLFKVRMHNCLFNLVTKELNASIFTMCILHKMLLAFGQTLNLGFVSVCGDGEPARWSAQCPRWVQWCSQWSSWREGWLQEALWWVSFRDHCACDEQDQEVNVNVKSLLTSYKVVCNNW